MRFKIGNVFSPKGVCHLGKIQNVPNWARMHMGVPQSGSFPEDACFKMSPDFPKDVKLADVLANIETFLVVSERLKDFLVSEKALAHNEILDVGIVNHKGRREKANCFIIHQIDNPKCIDHGKTVGTKSKMDPDEYLALDTLVLDEKKIGKDFAIFRPFEYKERVFFRDDIAAKIEEEGFSGIELVDIETYDDF